MKPFYSREGIIIYLGDSRKILPLLTPGTIVTDPPYPDYLTELYQQTPINFLDAFSCRQLVFWSAKSPFPLSYTAIHVWDKWRGAASEYERIFERNGQNNYKVFRRQQLNNKIDAQMNYDILTPHKSQKPVRLMWEIINKLVKAGPIVDPFMGSGATLEAAYKLGYQSIGIELEEEYAQMAVDRLSRLPLRMPNKQLHPNCYPSTPTQLSLIDDSEAD